MVCCRGFGFIPWCCSKSCLEAQLLRVFPRRLGSQGKQITWSLQFLAGRAFSHVNCKDKIRTNFACLSIERGGMLESATASCYPPCRHTVATTTSRITHHYSASYLRHQQCVCQPGVYPHLYLRSDHPPRPLRPVSLNLQTAHHPRTTSQMSTGLRRGPVTAM